MMQKTIMTYRVPYADTDQKGEVTAYVKEQRGVRISIACEVRRQGEDKILVSGFTTHCFVSTETFRPIPPEALLEKVCRR